MIPPTIQRYFRKVIAHPDGAVVHDGDCYIFSRHVCTCGLLHALLPLVCSQENNEEIYPKFWEEWSQQESILEELKFGEK